jgi:hypothetical protein
MLQCENEKIDPCADTDELSFRIDLILKRLRQKPTVTKKLSIKSLYNHPIKSLHDYQTRIAVSYHDIDLEKLIEN